MTKNIFFCGELGPAGGIESFMYYIAKHFKNDPAINIEVWFVRADAEQLKLMQTVCKCVNWQFDKIIECDNFFFPSRNCHEDILQFVKAKNIIECFHMAEAFDWNTRTSTRVTKCIAVSNAAAKEWTKKTGIKCETYYPIIDIEQPTDRVKLSDSDCKLHIISCSRLNTPDKGSALMNILADRLDARNIPYEWEVYGLFGGITNNNIVYKGRTLDKNKMFAEVVKNDFFVQLSRAEGFGMSIAEALHLEVPLVSTPITTIKEHLTDDSNCIIFNFDGSNVDEVIDKMVNNKYSYKYEGPSSDWRSLLCQK